ncbi:MAG: FG-GAP repeat domain-containing protein [Leadbetterella sp.]
MKKRIASLLIFSTFCITGYPQNQKLALDKWQYIPADTSRAMWGNFDKPEWLRYYGLDFKDINKDGYKDIISGRYFYLNPGGNLEAPWKRSDLGMNVDACILTDIDGDEYADAIGMAYPNVYWLESDNWEGSSWVFRKIGEVPKTDHVNGQGFRHIRLTENGREEILLSAETGLFAATIPEDPTQMGNWKFTKIASSNSDEGIGYGDLDGDGDLDIALGTSPQKGKFPTILNWFENPGHVESEWKSHAVGTTVNSIDRIECGDFDKDGKIDIAVSEELYPGLEPVAHLYTFRNPGNSKSSDWARTIHFTGFSNNNLDAADLDNDGDIDLVTGEHKGKEYPTLIFENNGKGDFTKRILDKGKESHLGTQLVDLDGDGDQDLVSVAWDHEKYLHVWRNDAIKINYTFKHLSTKTNDIPLPWQGSQQQTDNLVADFDKNGVNDFVVSNRTTSPSVVFYRENKGKWDRYVVDNEKLTIGTGGVLNDVDHDGDMDFILLSDYSSPNIWWWENPYPNFDPKKTWVRRNIKKSGGSSHHDSIIGDFDGDGKDDFVFWNQNAKILAISKFPDKPKEVDEWAYTPIYRFEKDGEMAPIHKNVKYPGWRTGHEHEGLAKGDIDGDGVLDIIGGGRWFKFDKKTNTYLENIVDASYTFSRAAVGQLIEGGRPEIVFSLGDGIGPLYIYEFKRTYDDWNHKLANYGTWQRRMLIDKVYDGHSIDMLDFNADGHMDIYIGEMKLDSNSKARVMIYLGDGKGNFVKHIIAEGREIHEGKLIDLNGDGKLDMLSKPYVWDTPRLDIFLNTTSK